jgi:hypothetical protein
LRKPDPPAGYTGTDFSEQARATFAIVFVAVTFTARQNGNHVDEIIVSSEARKFSCDDRLRFSTPGREIVRPKTPALSRYRPLIFLLSFIVMLMVIGIITERRYDERNRRSKT